MPSLRLPYWQETAKPHRKRSCCRHRSWRHPSWMLCPFSIHPVAHQAARSTSMAETRSLWLRWILRHCQRCPPASHQQRQCCQTLAPQRPPPAACQKAAARLPAQLLPPVPQSLPALPAAAAQQREQTCRQRPVHRCRRWRTASLQASQCAVKAWRSSRCTVTSSAAAAPALTRCRVANPWRRS